MAVSGSLSKVASTTTSITVSWSITTSASGFVEIYVNGPFGNLYSGESTGKPINGTATVTGLNPGTSYSFNWGAQDLANQFGSGSASFTTDSTPPPPPPANNPPAWSDNTLTQFIVGRPYSDFVGATSSPTYSVSAGTLPDGISLNASTGAVTGTPTKAGTYSFTITATNAYGSVNQAFSGVVAGGVKVKSAGSTSTATVKVYDGSNWVTAPVRVFNGSTWVLPVQS